MNLVIFTKELIAKNTGESGPIIIHCSAGIGRTGSFCAVFNEIQEFDVHIMEKPKESFMVDMYRQIQRLRSNRPGMVQTAEQLEFCYVAFFEYYKKTHCKEQIMKINEEKK